MVTFRQSLLSEKSMSNSAKDISIGTKMSPFSSTLGKTAFILSNLLGVNTQQVVFP